MWHWLYQNTIARLVCAFVGHWGVINTHTFEGVCSRCGGKYRISYDMTYGETVWLERIRKK